MAFNPKFIRTFAPENSNTYANEKKNPNSTAVFGTIRHTEENLPEKPNEKKPSKWNSKRQFKQNYKQFVSAVSQTDLIQI